jgi:hypothetical protein
VGLPRIDRIIDQRVLGLETNRPIATAGRKWVKYSFRRQLGKRGNSLAVLVGMPETVVAEKQAQIGFPMRFARGGRYFDGWSLCPNEVVFEANSLPLGLDRTTDLEWRDPIRRERTTPAGRRVFAGFGHTAQQRIALSCHVLPNDSQTIVPRFHGTAKGDSPSVPT